MKAPGAIIAAAGFLAAFSPDVRADSGAWRLLTEKDGTAVETIVIDRPGPAGGKLMTILNLGFGPKDGCVPELAIAVLKGAGYGKPQGKVLPPNTDPVGLKVDD